MIIEMMPEMSSNVKDRCRQMETEIKLKYLGVIILFLFKCGTKIRKPELKINVGLNN